MESFSREFALFIDGIRLEKGLSRTDLIDGIISLSQYKRYLRGVASIPNDVVLDLANTLKYNISDLYTLYTKKYSKDDIILRDVYKLITSYKYEEAFLELQSINDDLLVSNFYKSFYDFCTLLTQHKLGRVSDIHVLSLYSTLIDYPNCMNNVSFNIVELSVLQQIVVISSNMKNYEPANELFRILTSGNFGYASIGDNSFLPVIYYNVARVFLKQDDYDKTIRISNKGIEIALENQNSNALPHLFNINAISNKRIGNIEKAKKAMKKCFMQLVILDNKAVYDTFLKSYEENFDIPIEDFLCDFSDFM